MRGGGKDSEKGKGWFVSTECCPERGKGVGKYDLREKLLFFHMQRELKQKNFQKFLAVVNLTELDRTSRKGQASEEEKTSDFHFIILRIVWLGYLMCLLFINPSL